MIEVSKGNPYICGASKLNNKTYNFTIVTDSDDVSLLIYDNKFNLKHEIKLGSEYRFGGALSLCLSKESLDKALYCYKLDGKFYIDPYSKTISNKNKFGIKSEDEELFLSRVVLDPYDWSLDKDVKLPFSDMILYKMHARGFTKSRTSQVLAKGTFAGIEEKLPYLRKLGITAVELMPVYEFDETGRYEQLHEQNSIYRAAPSRAAVNYWGYTKGFHFALKPSFCSIAGTKSDYTTEFKDLVKAMHRAGLEMILEFYFDKEPYEYVKECLRFYKDEYHIDGAHIYSRDYVIYGLAEDPNFRDFKIIVDNLYMMYSDYSDLLDKKKNFAVCNRDFMTVARKFLKGDEDQLPGFSMRQRFNPTNYAVINTITNHDGFTLCDLVSYERKHNEANGENNRDGENYNNSWNCGAEGRSRKKKIVDLRLKQIKNALMMLFLSQGTPMLLAGDEFLNSQGGNNNPYCIDGETTWLNWKDSDEALEIFEFVRKLIAFRKKHKILHMSKPLYATDMLECGYPDISYHSSSAWIHNMEPFDRQIGIMLCSKYDGQKKDNILIYMVYNMHWERHELAIPNLPKKKKFTIAFCTDKDTNRAIRTSDRTLVLEARTSAVLICNIDDEDED